MALGAPVSGWVIDTFGAGWGFAAAGLAGLLAVAAALPFWQRPMASVAEPASLAGASAHS
jgi:sugar/nucleoside kinase (ribokinase family)